MRFAGQVAPQLPEDLMSKEGRALDYGAFKSCISESANYLKSLRGHIAGKPAQYEFQVVLGELIRRAALHVMAIDRLADNFVQDPSFKQPIFVLLRTLIADTILAIYLTESLFVDESRNKVSFSNTGDFIERYDKHTIASLKKIEGLLEEGKNEGVITQDLIDKVFKNWKKNLPKLFNKDGNFKKKGNITIRGMATGLKEAGEQSYAKSLYENYVILSQYEHFSQRTEDWMNNSNIAYEDAERVIDCLHIILSWMDKTILYLDLDKKWRNNLSNITNKIKVRIKDGITIIC